MKRWVYVSVAVLGLAMGIGPGRAAAQLPMTAGSFGGTFGRPPANPLGTPTVSPFLNLGRGGSAAVNYYGVVRPQMQTQQSIQQLQQQLQLEQAAGLAGPMGYPLITGHETRFQNYSTFYPPMMVGPGLRR